MSDNKYGLDTAYFRKNLKIILRDVDRYKPDEMQRALKRLANVALNQHIKQVLPASSCLNCSSELKP